MDTGVEEESPKLVASNLVVANSTITAIDRFPLSVISNTLCLKLRHFWVEEGLGGMLGHHMDGQAKAKRLGWRRPRWIPLTCDPKPSPTPTQNSKTLFILPQNHYKSKIKCHSPRCTLQPSRRIRAREETWRHTCWIWISNPFEFEFELHVGNGDWANTFNM